MRKKVCVIFICFACCVFVQAQDSIVSVACVGNSITAGYGLENPVTESYPAQLHNILNDSSWHIHNFGVSARTMLKHGDLPYWNEPQYTQALELNPNIVIIKLGTNDSKLYNWNMYGNEFVANYIEMIRTFQNLASKPQVYICTAIPGENKDWDISNAYIADSVNHKIEHIALSIGVNVIDLYSVFEGKEPELLLQDGVHPNAQGARVIATEVAKSIMQPQPHIIYADGVLSAPYSYGYQWFYNGEAISDIHGGHDREFVPEQEGVYTVLIQAVESSMNMIVSKEYMFKL